LFAANLSIIKTAKTTTEPATTTTTRATSQPTTTTGRMIELLVFVVVFVAC